MQQLYHATVMAGLHEGCFLSGTAKTKFIGCVAAAIFRFKVIPPKKSRPMLDNKFLLNVHS